MKITLELPDSTKCAFVDIVYSTRTEIVMQSHPVSSDELYDGAEIGITREG